MGGWGNGELRQLALCGLGRPLSGEGGGAGEAGTVAHGGLRVRSRIGWWEAVSEL